MPQLCKRAVCEEGQWHNLAMSSTSATGYLGVTKMACGKYIARSTSGERTTVGTYDTAQSAALALAIHGYGISSIRTAPRAKDSQTSNATDVTEATSEGAQAVGEADGASESDEYVVSVKDVQEIMEAFQDTSAGDLLQHFVKSPENTGLPVGTSEAVAAAHAPGWEEKDPLIEKLELAVQSGVDKAVISNWWRSAAARFEYNDPSSPEALALQLHQSRSEIEMICSEQKAALLACIHDLKQAKDKATNYLRKINLE